MKVQFKNCAQVYDCSEPIEQKIYRSGVEAGWTIVFQFNAGVTSSEIDSLITPDNISEITFTNDTETANTIRGYNAISSCTIRHKSSGTVVEVQLTKTNDIKEGGDKAAAEKGV